MQVKKIYLLLLAVALVSGLTACAFGGNDYADVNVDEKVVPIVDPRQANLATTSRVLIAYLDTDEAVTKVAWQIQASMGGVLLPLTADNSNDLGTYELVFIGYPLGQRGLPEQVRNFVATHNFNDKEVLLFGIGTGGDLQADTSVLSELMPQAKVMQGLSLQEVGTGKMQKKISEWLIQVPLAQGKHKK